MSCDNLRGNGDTARRAVLAVAERHGRDLLDTIAEAVAFPNSMVDRIAPAISKADRQAINAASGIDDALPATCESYTSWVMEDRFCDGRPPFERAGVQLRDDVAAFVAVKGRLSNAAHMLMCYPSLLMGERLVNKAMADPRITQLLQAFWTIDAIPLIEAPPGLSPQRFTAEVIERFANPGINDQLLRVAGDGASKIEVFHGKTIQELIEGSRPLDREAFLLACYVRYLGGRDDLDAAYPVHEPALEESDRRLFGSTNPADGLALSLMRRVGADRSEAFRAAFTKTFDHICRHGVSSALDAILGKTERLGRSG
jgi:mannitol-1-phosphate/altronate dehydrogenase